MYLLANLGDKYGLVSWCLGVIRRIPYGCHYCLYVVMIWIVVYTKYIPQVI